MAQSQAKKRSQHQKGAEPAATMMVEARPSGEGSSCNEPPAPRPQERAKIPLAQRNSAAAVCAPGSSAVAVTPQLFDDPNRTFLVIDQQSSLAMQLRLAGGSVITGAPADSARQNTIVVLDKEDASTTDYILQYGRCGAVVVSSGVCITLCGRACEQSTVRIVTPTHYPQTRLRGVEHPQRQCRGHRKARIIRPGARL